ncbi:kelch-like protein 10 [Watersipora subatra]|uniref:kelch-like protein 10 n=1 Tax=Watersipora subatra TaxID=2589382 RepID=UPI00355B3181
MLSPTLSVNQQFEWTKRVSSASSVNKDTCQRKISADTYAVISDIHRRGQLCDAILKADGVEFPVHRLIMSACSPYFRALFTNGLYETEQKVLEIPQISARVMDIIIEFAYSREASISTDNVEELLPVADQLHILGLVKACCQFLKSLICVENCIGIRNFARTYFCTHLDNDAMRFVLRNFQEVCEKSIEMLSLSLEEMTEILSHEELNVKTEEPVFEAIIRWIDHDTASRKQHIFPLLECVRLCLLSTSYFVEKVKAHPYVSGSDQCKPLVIETIKFLYDLDISDDKEVDQSNPLARPRIPHEILFAIGGWSGGSPTNVMETYDTRADRWIECQWGDPLGPRAYHGTATIDGLIYICGGFDGIEYFNSTRCFHPLEKTWTDVSPMNARRCYVSVTVLDKKIYAMGGYDGANRQNSAERYDPSSNQWSLIAPMSQQRSDASAATLNDKVFIVGGFNGTECMNSAEYYNPTTNQWTGISQMRSRRSGIGIIAHHGCIFAIGGFNGVARLSTAEKWDSQRNTWTTIAEMYSPRSNYAIEVIDDMIFAIGGFNGVTTIFNVECYDDKLDEWYDATDMNVYRSALSACVVKGLVNIREYIHKHREVIKIDKAKNSSHQQNRT